MQSLVNESIGDRHKKIIKGDLARLQAAPLLSKAEIGQQTIFHLVECLFDAMAEIEELKSRIETIKKNRSLAFDESGVSHG